MVLEEVQELDTCSPTHMRPSSRTPEVKSDTRGTSDTNSSRAYKRGRGLDSLGSLLLLIPCSA